MKSSVVIYNVLAELVQEVISDDSHILKRKWFTPEQLMIYIENHDLVNNDCDFTTKIIAHQMTKIISILNTIHYDTRYIKNKENKYRRKAFYLILGDTDIKHGIPYPLLSLPSEEKRPNSISTPRTPTPTPT